MRKKLIALSLALLTIGGSVSSITTARADVLTSGATTYLLAAAGERTTVFRTTSIPSFQQVSDNDNVNNGVYWYDQEVSDVGDWHWRSLGFSPNSYVFLGGADVCGSYLNQTPSSYCPNAPDDGSDRLSFQSTGTPLFQGGWRIGKLDFLNHDTSTVKEVWQSGIAPDAAPSYYLSGIQKNVSVSTIADGGWTLCYSESMGTTFDEGEIEAACTGKYILLAGGYRTGQEPAPALTLPPDFLTPKTYGNPASVTGTAPAAPAVALTPTAPVITASATSVIYNGVPQSATYSVDQESSCSTTYNGSAIAPVAAGTYAVSITCSANSLTSTATTTLTITKAAPVISWSTPAAITSTTKLGASQLNAFSYTPGSFTYSAASSAIGAGSTLPAGDDLVTATFTPTDSTNYTTSTMTVTIHVTP